jgi:hypothetical protein
MISTYIFYLISITILLLSGGIALYILKQINNTRKLMKRDFKFYLDDKTKLDYAKKELTNHLIFYEALRKNYYELYIEENNLEFDEYVAFVALQEEQLTAIEKEDYELAGIIQKKLDKLKKNLDAAKNIQNT